MLVASVTDCKCNFEVPEQICAQGLSNDVFLPTLPFLPSQSMCPELGNAPPPANGSCLPQNRQRALKERHLLHQGILIKFWLSAITLFEE